MKLTAWVSAKPPARLTVPVPADTLTATATVFALIALPALARIVTSPRLSTSELSMLASVSLVMVFDVKDTAPVNARLTVPEPADTAPATANSVASIVLALSATRVIGPPALTKCDGAGNKAASASAISAWTVPPIVLVAIAAPTAPLSVNVPLLALTDTATLVPRASMFLSEVAKISSAPPASSDESSTCAWTSLSTRLVATATAAVRLTVTVELPAATLNAAVATSESTLAESVALMLAAPPASTLDPPMTPASIVLLIVLVAPTPAPAPDRPTEPPLLTPTLSDAATPRASIEPTELACASKPAPAVTVAPCSTTARVVLLMLFSATVTATASETALLPLLIAALSAAAATSAVIVVASDASSETDPAVAFTSAARMMASTELFVSLVATAPAPVSATELLLELMATLADAATTSASMSFDEVAVRLTSPTLAVLSTPSMTASVVLVMSFNATATATPPAMALPSLLSAKFTCADTASARMVPLSLALRVRLPPAVTVLAVPGAESLIAARVVLTMVLVVTATFALRLAAVPSLDCEMVSEAPNAVASIEAVLDAVTETLPSAATVESSMTASAELVISLIATARPSPIPTLVPLSTLIDAVTAPAVAVMSLASVAETVTLPVASTTLGSMIAVVVEVM